MKNGQRLGLVTAVWLSSELLLLLVLFLTTISFFDASSWARYDSYHYLEIAGKGYSFFSCQGLDGFATDTKDWCGNAGWFPGYPLLIRALSATGMSGILAAALISRLFFLGILWLFTLLLSIDKWSRSAFLTLLSATVFFGAIYYKAAFPVSAVLFLGLFGAYLLWKEKYSASALFALLASFFYPTGFLFAGAFALYALAQGGWNKKVLLQQVLPFIVAVILGMGAAFWVIWMDTGVWDAFLRVQAKYGHGPQNPIKNVGIMAKQIDATGFHLKDLPRYQSLVVIACFFTTSFFFFRHKSKMENLDRLAYILFACFFLFPWLVGGNLSLYRAESLLVPVLLLTRNWTTSSRLVLCFFLLLFFFPMSYLFFSEVLI